mmetsp:Transcript_9273/g.12754  ORF Transcript_9273/g.12754 Transcript_9273/m.12754 type:complete len:377 (+) Transcript_9273:186-1316(+)|eukprot:CAMPEP_0185263536 /NCGR_PEP_ID=MMETSP1359-20130426/15273_1 /TAXON_ID=552665 /ORGANISM="Bigelowiella longifila, Strain CCMP242" /LENGTH=376 /DNA_ID=CAMNT_0027851129 /DNA_START=128 /DNA_END=1258 /DNA_ORIENTATION=+
MDVVVDVPNDFICPISRCLMKHPTINDAGSTYEYLSIAEWFALGHRTDPISGVKVHNPTLLIPNRSLKSQIEDWRQKHAEHPEVITTRRMQKADYRSAIKLFQQRNSINLKHQKGKGNNGGVSVGRPSSKSDSSSLSSRMERKEVISTTCNTSGGSEKDITEFTIITLGDCGVGKSCLLHRYAKNSFNTLMPFTCGPELYFKRLRVKGKNVKLTIWDTAGQEQFRSITRSYYTKADGALLVYDITRRNTFSNLLETKSGWLSELEDHCGKKVEKVIVGARADLSAFKDVSIEDVHRVAEKHSLDVFETSAKTGLGVDKAMERLVEKLLEREMKKKKSGLYDSRGNNIHRSNSTKLKLFGSSKGRKSNHSNADLCCV